MAERYSIVVDLREPAVALDASRVSELAERYATEPGGGGGRELASPYTDLLLLSSAGRERLFARPAA